MNAAFSATIEPRDHTTASASASNALTKSTSDSGSATTLSFEHARKLNSAPSSPWEISAPDADHRRSGSPSGGSTLMTSAPPSASNLVQYAPAMPVDRSTTTNPSSGGTGHFFFLRFFLLSRNSGGNLSSLSLTAAASPLSMDSIMSRSSAPSAVTPLPIDSKKAERRLPMYSPWCCL